MLISLLGTKRNSILMYNGDENDAYYYPQQQRLTKKDILNQPKFADLSEAEIESLIEFLWDYSVIVYKSFKKTNDSDNYE